MNILNNDITKIYILLLFSIIIRYFLPLSIGNAYFLLLLVIFYRTRQNYLWIAFFFILLQPPGYLFYHIGNYSLPKFSVTSTVQISYFHLVFMVAVLKSRKYIIYKGSFFKNGIKILLGYLIFLTFITIVYDENINRIFGIALGVMPFLSLFFIPRLITSESQYVNLFKILFSVVFLLIFSQVWDVIMARPFAMYLGEVSIGYSGRQIFDNELTKFYAESTRAGIYGSHLMLISFIASFYYLTIGVKHFNKNYLYIIISLITLSFILSGTRGWIICSLFIIFFFVINNIKFPSHAFKMVFIPILIILSIFIISDTVQRFVYSGIERLTTINLLLSGDITAGGTLGRLSIRSPRVMDKFEQSPIIGFGFTDDFKEYRDSHVGHQTMLLNGGIIGYLLFMLFFIQYNYKLYYAYKSASRNNIYRKSIFVFIIGFAGMFILHSSSIMMFGYEVGMANGLMLGLFFVFSDFTYKALWQIERSNNSKAKSI